MPRWAAVLGLLSGSLGLLACGPHNAVPDDAAVPVDAANPPDAVLVPSVCVADPGGTLRDNELPTTVVTAPQALPPIMGGTLAISRNARYAVLSDPERGQVVLVDLLVGPSVLGTLELGLAAQPWRIAEDDAGQFHVVLRGTGQLATISPNPARLLRLTPVCPNPRGVVFDPTLQVLHLACKDGTLLSLSPSDDRELRRVFVAEDLRDVVVSRFGLLVSTFRRAEVFPVDSVGTVGPSLRPPLTAIERWTNGASRTVEFSAQVGWKLAVREDGTPLLAHEREQDSPVIPTRASYYNGISGSPGVVSAALTELCPGELARETPFLGDIALPVDVASSPDGSLLAVVDAGRRLSAGGLRLLPPSLLRETSPDRYVSDVGSDWSLEAPGTPVAVSFVNAELLAVQTREPSALVLLRPNVAPLVVSTATDMLSDTGHLLFHTVSQFGSVACASCHPEGTEDGHTWDFNCDGFRRTQSVRGGLLGTEPFHWDGSQADFSVLLHGIYTRRLRLSPPSVQQVQALARWVQQLPEYAPEVRSDTALIAEGQRIFASEDTGCASCHAGTAGTDNQNHVLSLGSFQTPALHGVSQRSPYMHDGCAATLQDAIRGCGPVDRHGHTSHLSASQLAALEAYLRAF